MILKFRMMTHEKPAAWRIIDKVRRVDWEYVEVTEVLRERTEKAGIIFICLHKQKPESDFPKMVTEIRFMFESGNQDMFYTDEMVFILNDEGKTCDTINCSGLK